MYVCMYMYMNIYKQSTEESCYWEADNRSYGQEIPWTPKGHYRVHNSPPLVLS
jgi:hypothetical protein